MVTGLGVMIYLQRTQPDGLPMLDLDAPVDFKSAFRELKQFARGDFSSLKNLTTNPSSSASSGGGDAKAAAADGAQRK